MKKTFPIITVLISISLFGLIFFQYLWLQSVKDIKAIEAPPNSAGSVSELGRAAFGTAPE